MGNSYIESGRNIHTFDLVGRSATTELKVSWELVPVKEELLPSSSAWPRVGVSNLENQEGNNTSETDGGLHNGVSWKGWEVVGNKNNCRLETSSYNSVPRVRDVGSLTRDQRVRHVLNLVARPGAPSGPLVSLHHRATTSSNLAQAQRTLVT